MLRSQGFGTLRECVGLVRAGLVAIEGTVVDDPASEVETEGLSFAVRDTPWTWREHALLVMHKPAGHECSLKPRHHPGVHTLLPSPLRASGVQPIGRLDEDTTGALLFTDDGTLIHRLTSPKHHVEKVYQVTCKHPVDDAQVQRLREGVTLHEGAERGASAASGASHAGEVVRAQACERTGDRTLELVLTEGRYHQVKRMVAAAGNRVEALHRRAFGGIGVEGLAPGAWRWLSDGEEAALRSAPRTQGPR